MKSQIAVMMIVAAVGWVETIVETTTMIQNAHLAIGGVGRAKNCPTVIPIVVDTTETDSTIEIVEMIEKVRTFFSELYALNIK